MPTSKIDTLTARVDSAPKQAVCIAAAMEHPASRTGSRWWSAHIVSSAVWFSSDLCCLYLPLDVHCYYARFIAPLKNDLV